jgi:ATPase subunit of ABC transporter with duplicated ATPase domains
MMHTQIQFNHLSLSFPHKTCFEDFTAQVPYGSRIAIIGRNGSGKSSLLTMLQGASTAYEGTVRLPKDTVIGYVPQLIEDVDTSSGGERFNKALTAALSAQPNVLLLDEPTNHLDSHNRKSLLRMLSAFPGTLLIVTHDVELLRSTVDTLWHIDQGKIHIFSGNYDDYQREIRNQRASLEAMQSQLNRQQKDMHHALMREQVRAAKSRAKGEKSINNRKWPTVVSHAKAGRAENTSNRKKADIRQNKQDLSEKLAELAIPEIITPTFSLTASERVAGESVSIVDGQIGYAGKPPLLCAINFSVGRSEKLAILGANGSGKTSLLKAIINDPHIHKSGYWHTPKPEDIGYLDQQYGTLDKHKTVFETIQECVPHWPITKIRFHLSDFLFRKNDAVNALVSTLSGGEKARLCLAQIAAQTPRLLILDEITNNLDLETYEQVVHVLKSYPGTMIVISHQPEFLDAIGINTHYEITK